MLKIVHKICCGVDVHKKFIVATIAKTENNVTKYARKKFNTFTTNLEVFKLWLDSHNCNNVCMENTGKYWIPIYNVIEESCNVTLANPRYIKNIPGKKTDNRDSQWIADLHMHGLVRGSFIPPKPIRELRDLQRYRFKLVNMRSSEKNRFQNSLTISNLMISSVVSDTFGKSASAIIRYAMEHPDDKNIDFSNFLHKSMLHKSDDINASMQGTISNEQNAKMSVCLNHFDYINICIEQLDKTISIISNNFKNQMDILSTIPGITSTSACRIISEIGVNMSVFDDSKHLCSWAGLTPQNNESAGKKKSVRISRAGCYIKPLLVQCANAAIKDKKCPYFNFRYQAIKKRRGHKRAIIAIARMLLTCIFNILSKNEPFNYSLYQSYLEKNTKNISSASKQTNIEYAIALLQSQGFNVTKTAVSPLQN
jgi:transposase